MNNAVSGFSKLSKEDKINWIANEYFATPNEAIATLKQYWNSNEKLQQLHDEFIENTITNFYLPMGIAPNFLVNGKYYSIPMVIEESSVVAAAAKSLHRNRKHYQKHAKTRWWYLKYRAKKQNQ